MYRSTPLARNTRVSLSLAHSAPSLLPSPRLDVLGRHTHRMLPSLGFLLNLSRSISLPPLAPALHRCQVLDRCLELEAEVSQIPQLKRQVDRYRRTHTDMEVAAREQVRLCLWP